MGVRQTVKEENDSMEIETTKIFDTHAHYDNESFDEDRENLLRELPEMGVGKVVNVGASLSSCKAARKLAE